MDQAFAESVLDSLPRAVLTLEDRKITYVNAATENIFGWKPEELLGKNTRVLYRNDEEYEQLGENVYSALEKKASHSEMYPCKHKDGRDIVCNIDLSRLGGRLEKKRVVVMYEDISERIEAEKELQESEEQYRNFIENTNEILQSMALDGQFLSANKAWHKAFGYDDKELAALNIFDMVAGDLKQHLKDIFEKAVTNTPVIDEEIRFSAKDGHEVILQGNLIPRTFYGKVVNVRCFFSDVTENRRVQKEINEKIEELEMFNKLAVDRELKMIELKNKIKELEEKLQKTNAGNHRASQEQA